MYLYNITLQRPTAIVQAIYGNFSGAKSHEIVVSRGRILELLLPDETGKVQTILSTDVFGIIRSIVAFRLTGASKDFIIVGSDSGRIIILEYNGEKNTFEKLHQETYGKSGVRRAAPGQYLAADPKGRAVMIGSLEKQKFVYILNRDAQARLTISSPLEAHKAHTLLFSVCGVDRGFENPIFACLELDYEGEDGATPHKALTYYELDLGLNHVVRQWSDAVDSTANLVITVPGGVDGPGGVLVCSENCITYKHQNHPDVKAILPRRVDSDPNKGVLLITYTSHKQKDKFFILVQSEYGDIYKVTLIYEEEVVNEVKIRYFDTVPVATSLCVMKNGFLFVASEFGNHFLYQFQSLADEEDDTTYITSNSSSTGFDAIVKQEPISENSMEISSLSEEKKIYFIPHSLKNLAIIDELESLSPIIDFKIEDIAREETPQIYVLNGRGTRSNLRILRHGISVAEMAVSPLPGNPSSVWSVKRSINKDVHDRFIVISFLNMTLILSIGETVEPAVDSGLLENTPTLLVNNIGDDGIIQVHPYGIRHIRYVGATDKDKRIHEWKTPGKKAIVKATSNLRQVVIALSGGDLIYFELDSTGHLVDIDKKFLGKEVASLDIAPISEGKQKSRFLAVGDVDNSNLGNGPMCTVRIFSLDADDCLQSLSVQALPIGTVPDSLSLIEISNSSTINTNVTNTLYLNIGLNNGVLLRAVVDSITGELSDTRTRYIGSRSVKLFKVKVKGANALLALSSRPWLGYNHQSRFQLTPLSYTTLEYASHFTSEQCPEGIVSISGNTLRIFAVERLGQIFHSSEIPLLHTPKKFIIHPQFQYLIIIESDHNSGSSLEKTKFKSYGDDNSMEVENGTTTTTNTGVHLNKEERIFGTIKPGSKTGRWGSAIHVVDTLNNKTLDVVELPGNEAALSICTCVFHDRDGEVYIIVGTAKDWMIDESPKAHDGGFIHVFRITADANGTIQLSAIHKTPVDHLPTALCPFQGRLLVGGGKSLRIFDLGKKKLLRKCENRTFPISIINVQTQGDRIYVSDVQESIHFVKYKKNENQFYIFADETVPRYLTSTILLDYDSICGTDKFGNVFVSRLPSKLSDEIESDVTGSALSNAISGGTSAVSTYAPPVGGYLNGAPHKLENVINFYLGETSNCIAKGSLVPGGAEAIIYTTMLGTIGALLPFNSREDVDFFSHLEMHLRQENPPLCGRDHLSFRSYYFPVKNVIDGDFCEQFASLDPEKQKQIAEDLERSPAEVLKKLEDIRNRLL